MSEIKITKESLPTGVMLNAYPDSCGGSISEIIKLLKTDEFKDVFSSLYILPSLFHSDLDRGFSVISYDINSEYASESDLNELKNMGVSLKLDFVLNHLSAQSPQFKDLLEKGDKSLYLDYFIDWNKFWANKGDYCSDGYIIPKEKYLNKLFMRKPGLPILKVPFPDGSYRFFWNTFYQNIKVQIPNIKELQKLTGLSVENTQAIKKLLEAGLDLGRNLEEIKFGEFIQYRKDILHYLERNCLFYQGQMDLNAESKQVWEFYQQTFEKLNRYGAKIVRLDAFAYLHKQAGMSNFFNKPGTWEYLDKIKIMADSYGITLLPEIHSTYGEKLHEKLVEKGYPIYDFFFPGLVLHALETANSLSLKLWINEILEKKMITINMLGSHDGIPLLDVKGILNVKSIDTLIETLQSRGGRVKDLFDAEGKKISYYQVNSTFFSALNEDENKFLIARAIQLFMPGIPQIWYLDLFAGVNDYSAADSLGHKEINRSNFSVEEIKKRLEMDLVKKQLTLLKFRNNFPAFGKDASIMVKDSIQDKLIIEWHVPGYTATLKANLQKPDFQIYFSEADNKKKILF